MRAGVRRYLSGLAILAITMHTVLWSPIPSAASAAIDPFSVICHSGSEAPAPDAQTPDAPGQPPSKACDHCSPCSTTAAPAALNSTLAGRLTPARLPQRLALEASTLRPRSVSDQTLPRGPPQRT
jgi:hypothetical protein